MIGIILITYKMKRILNCVMFILLLKSSLRKVNVLLFGEGRRGRGTVKERKNETNYNCCSLLLVVVCEILC